MTLPHERPGADVAESYDRWSESYDADANATRDLDALVVRAAKLPIAGARVLELGAGTGKNTAFLAGEAALVVALDFSAGMLTRARARVSSSAAVLVRADLRAPLPLADASIDVVVANLVLEHIADCAHVFAEASRVLRRGGTAFVCELHPARQARGGQAQFTNGARGERVLVRAYVHTIEEFIGAARAAGLTVDSVTDHVEAGASDPLPRLVTLRLTKA